MKLSQDAQTAIKKLCVTRQDIDTQINVLCQGIALGMGIDLSKKALSLDTMEFIDKAITQ